MTLRWRGSSKGLERLWNIGNVICFLIGVSAGMYAVHKYHPKIEELLYIPIALAPLALYKLFFMVTGLEKQRLQGNITEKLSNLKSRIEDKVQREREKGRIPRLQELENEFDKVSKYSTEEAEVRNFQDYLDQLRQEYPQEETSPLKEQLNAFKDIGTWAYKTVFSGKTGLDIAARVLFAAGSVLIAINFWNREFIETMALWGWFMNYMAFVIFLRKNSGIIVFGGSFMISTLLMLGEMGIVFAVKAMLYH